MGLSISNQLRGSTGLSVGLGLSRGNRLYFSGFGGGAPFSPAELFANGEPGGWYQPSDLTTLFQDSAGTLPVTAVEQPVGLMLDKSRGLVLGSELVTNGDFASGTTTGWTAGGTSPLPTISVSSGELVVTNSTVSFGNAYQTINCTIGKWYKVTATARRGTSPKVYVITRTSLGSGGLAAVETTSTTNVSLEFYFLATVTTVYLILSNDGGSGVTGYFDNITVKEIAGNHLYQSTSTARPVLSARVNLLTQTEAFNEAVWFKGPSSSINANSTTAPDGTTTADTYSQTAGSPYILQSITLPFATSVSASCCFKANVGDHVRIFVGDTATVSNGFAISVNISTGTIGTTGTFGTGGTFTSATITTAGNGFYRVTLTGQVGASNTAISFGWYVITSDNSTTRLIPGSVYIWGADLRVANDTAAPVYQRVGVGTPTTTNPPVTGTSDYDTVGFPLYLRFDGTDDFMVSPTITPGIDKAQVFAGVRKLAASFGQIIAELSADFSSFNGVFNLATPNSSPYFNYGFRSKGTLPSTADTSSGAYAPPITNVLTGFGDIAGDTSILRANGVQVASSSADQGTGNYLAYPLYVGARSGGTVAFNGRLYPLIVRFGATLTDTQIAQTESYVSTQMGGGYVPVGYDYLVDANGDQLTDASGNALYTIPLYS